MDKKILIDALDENNIQVAVVEDGRLEELEYTSNVKKLIKGNVYLAKVTRIEPSLQAAFIDFGDEKHGFIPFSEIHPDYYNVPFEHRIAEQSEQGTSQASDDEALADDSPDEENYMEKIKKQNAERYKIQEVLKRNQILLVQVVKEVRGNKGAMFTTYISLAGKYCVVMPKCISKGGISKRITNTEARKALQKSFNEISKKAELTFIIRTAGQGHSKPEIKTDYDYLVKLWNNVREKTLSANAPAFIYAEDDILKKSVRDLYDKDTSEIVVQGEAAYKNIQGVIKSMALTKYAKVSKYEGETPIFTAFKIDEQLSALYSPIVHLKSGAYIVINPTEALIAIDINSGRSTSERNIEKTAIKTNIEAAKEIARQIRLRELSGLIVIDFIDMLEPRNKSFVERTLRDFLRKDKARIQLGHISNFGLLEMSRQRLKPSFLELNTITCPQCNGNGVVKSDATSSSMILRTIEREISDNSNIKEVKVHLSSQAALFILNYKREEIKALEGKYKISIFILQDLSMGLGSFSMETVNKERNFNRMSDNVHVPQKPVQETVAEEVVPGVKEEVAPSNNAGYKKKSGNAGKEASLNGKNQAKLERKDDANGKVSKKTVSVKPNPSKSLNKKGLKKPRKISKVKTILDKLLG
jgi:ribonuclease E